MSENDYYKNLQRLAALDPQNLLLNKLRQGHTLVNAILLQKQLSNVVINPITETAKLEIDEDDDPVDDELLKKLRVKQRKLFSERAKYSDKFHTCKTNTERAYVSEDIQITQRNIERVMQQIRHYKLHGVLLEDENANDYVPKDGLALQKKLLSLRANISRQKKIVKEAEETLTDDPKDQRKLEKVKDRLVQLKTYKKNVEEAIKNLQ